MKKVSLMIAAVMLASAATGCSKKVELTVVNHTDVARTVQLTTPDQTLTLGTVGPSNGQLTGTMSVKVSDLPAQVRVAVGSAATNATVTEDSPRKWWFHVTSSGEMAGPYGKDDVHVETVKDAELNVKGGQRMIVR